MTALFEKSNQKITVSIVEQPPAGLAKLMGAGRTGPVKIHHVSTPVPVIRGPERNGRARDAQGPVRCRNSAQRGVRVHFQRQLLRPPKVQQQPGGVIEYLVSRWHS
jgi:hypothetical protein